MSDVVNRTISLARYRANPDNYNEHPDGQIADLRTSVRKFGQVRSVVVLDDGQGGFVGVAGHGFIEAAQAEGRTEVRADVIPPDWTAEMVVAYMAADNETARGSTPDLAKLAKLVDRLKEQDEELATVAAGGKDRLKELLNSLKAPAGDDPGPQVDKAAELQAKWQTALGQLWSLDSGNGNPHRLICGDCTDAATVARVMDGEKAQALVTDPPYAILGGGTSTAGKGIDASFDRQFFRAWFAALLAVLDDHLTHDAAQWMTIDWRGATAIEEALVNKRWRLAALGVWNRGGLGMGYALRKTYENFALLVARDWKRVKTDEPDVWSFQWTPGDRQQGHAAEKPVELMQRAIEVCSADGIVFDGFLGSGTTLIACEQLGRRARCIEIEPSYVAVCLERWATMTGQTPVLLEAGPAT